LLVTIVVAAYLSTVQLDTFNNRVLLGFDATVNITSVNTAGFLLQSGSRSVSLIGSTASNVNSSCIALSYGSNVQAFIVEVFASWSPITVNISSSAYSFANPVIQVYGEFSVELYCLSLAHSQLTTSSSLSSRN